MTRSLLCLSLLLSAPVGFAHEVGQRGEAFARPHQMIAVGNHRLNLYCSGTGSPTVVFDAPSGEAGWTWWAVQPKVSQKTRACVYDRPGFGFSDAATRAGTSENAVDDLHELLKAAGVRPPYVLVGNSLGGANVQLFTYRYPGEVAGLVLVEPMHEDEQARIAKASNGKLLELEAQMLEGSKACAAQSEKGFAPGSEMLQNCVGGLQPQYGSSLAAADLASRLAPAFWHAAMQEHEGFDLDRAQLRAARKPFGDLPLIVLVRSVSPYAIPGKPQSALNKATEAENLAMQKEVAQLSTRGEYRVVAGAGHIVQDDKPEAVVNAVDDMLVRIKR